MKKDFTVGDWQIDEYGRKFRMIGEFIKEYEKMIKVDGIEIPESELSAYYERKEAAAEARKHEAQQIAPRRGRCPFNSGINQSCTDKCALFTLDGCGLINKKAPGQMAGKSCPFSAYSCTTDCQLYNNGCRLAAR